MDKAPDTATELKSSIGDLYAQLLNKRHTQKEAKREEKRLERDFGEAFNWFLKAAEQGHAAAQYNVGYLYQFGEGVKISGKIRADQFETFAAKLLDLSNGKVIIR